MDASEFRARTVDDWPGLGSFLWRACTQKKCAGYHDAELCLDGDRHNPLGADWLQSLVWIGQQLHWRIRPYLLARCGRPAGCSLFRYHSVTDLRGVPVNVSHHHTCVDHWSIRSADE